MRALFFTADWCSVCHDTLPYIKLAWGAQKLNSHDLVVIDASTEEGAAYAVDHDVSGFPTILLYVGEDLVERIVGRITQAEFSRRVRAYL